MAYLVDAFRGNGLGGGLVDYTLFVAFFPQLIAGPIVHHREMMPQFARRPQGLDPALFVQGLFLLSLGLFKKVMVADSLAPLVAQAFDGGLQLGLIDAWTGALAYAFQLYFDFSGYTDMAWGAALLVGIRLPQNFNSPYRATSISDFWRRWHMTLGRFLRDYLYIPLGGNRMGQGRTLVNLFVTFLLGGLWHGAAWTFVVWGALHGAAMALERLLNTFTHTLPRPLAIVAVFLFVTVAWVFFRANDFQAAQRVLAGMAGLNGWQWQFQSLHPGNKALAWLGLAAMAVWFLPNSNQLAERVNTDSKWLMATIVLFLLAFWHLGKFSEFIYFQF
jgi:D-alanyl-lipoteichoic acid acyltransferase DltB (MBOAT superfamily)